MHLNRLILLTFMVLMVTGCEKVKYIDIDGECKYITIKGNPMMCSRMENKDEFETVYVDPCLLPVKQNGVLPSTEYCN
jgi:hypothetical protein